MQVRSAPRLPFFDGHAVDHAAGALRIARRGHVQHISPCIHPLARQAIDEPGPPMAFCQFQWLHPCALAKRSWLSLIRRSVFAFFRRGRDEAGIRQQNIPRKGPLPGWKVGRWGCSHTSLVASPSLYWGLGDSHERPCPKVKGQGPLEIQGWPAAHFLRKIA